MYKFIKTISVLVTVCYFGGSVVLANSMTVKEFVDTQDMSMQLEQIVIPGKGEGVSVSTLNGTGYVFNVPMPIANIFLKKECCNGKRVVDIGCGFNYIPIKALENGVSEYVANDISSDHLKILVKKAMSVLDENKLANLRMLHGSAPSILAELDGKYDAIFADKVIHFFSPSEIKDFVNLTKNLLTEKGRIYVTVSSVYGILGQNDDYKTTYLQNLKNGKEFPGYFTDVFSKFKEFGNDSIIILPEQMILFSKTDLENFFKINGMKVVHSCSLRVLHKDELGWEIVENESHNNYSDFIEIVVEKC